MSGNVYLIAGGRWDNFSKILRAIFQDIGASSPRIGYIGAANGENQHFFTVAREALRGAGFEVVRLDFRRGKPAYETLNACTVVFVSGGDVEEGMRVLTASGAAARLKAARARGVHFIGVSAGAIILAKQWLAWPAHDESRPYLFDCLGLAPVYCDTHDEPAWPELKALLGLLPGRPRGLGLNRGCAVKISGRRRRVLAGAVTVVKKPS